MNILWIAQKNLLHDLDISTWIEMCKALVQRNHHVTLVTLSTSAEKYQIKPPNLTIKEIRVINCFPLVAITFHLQIFWLGLFWLFSIRPGVIITHPLTVLFLLPTRLFSKLFKVDCKFILDVRTLPVRNKTVSDKIKNTIADISMLAANKFFNGITVTSASLKRTILERFHIDSERIGIWTAGVNIELFQPKTDIEHSVQPDNRKFIIIYHGAIAPNRGLFETAAAMALVNKIFPDICLVIVGQGLAYRDLITRVNQLNLKSAIHFQGKVSYNEIPDYISQADVGIIPLPDELCWQVSSPLKLLEYLAMAKPIIVSPIEAHRSILKDCPAAIFLKSTSPEDISKGIIDAYKMRNQLRFLGIEGRKLAMNKYTWHHQALMFEQFITNLTSV